MSHDQGRIANELARVKQAIKAHKGLKGIISDEQLQAVLAPLVQKLAALNAQIDGTGAIAQGNGSTAVAASTGGTAIGKVKGNVYIGPTPSDPSEALAVYRRVLLHTSGFIPLRGIDLGASDPAAEPKPLSLVKVYVELDTTTRKEPKEKGLPDQLPRPDVKEQPLGVLEAVSANRHVVLLGEPGSGKSTFVNHLSHCLAASGIEPDAGWMKKQLPHWPADEIDLLPLVIILRDFARGLPDPLPDSPEPDHLWQFISRRLSAQRLDFAAEPIESILDKGRALVLLDGLDEVPTTAQRIFVAGAVAAFMKRYADNRFIVTCRTLSYQPPVEGEPDLRLPTKIRSVEIARFDDDKIHRFIEAWYEEVARLGTVRAEDRKDLTKQLQQAVRRPDLWRLAPNPLLLTVMALVHTHRGRLPDARALLYEETVDVLLWRWEQIKTGAHAEAANLRGLLQKADRTEMDLKRVLWCLAFDAHAREKAEDKKEELADIHQWELIKALAKLNHKDFKWADQVVDTIKLRAGLLVERAPELFAFPHRTFQEYLAGAHLASQSDFARQAAEKAAAGSLWREVILLAVGRLVYLSGDTEKPLVLVGELCPQAAPNTQLDWRKVWLAGEVLAEMGLVRAEDSALGRDLAQRVRQRLAELVMGGNLKPVERSRTGDVLAQVVDPRKTIMTIEKMPFCFVPPGPFQMGSPDGETQASDHEKPLHECNLPFGYWISKYPVTVAQFHEFVKTSGYKPKNRESLKDLPNRPVRRVSWHDAMAFCRWLTRQWRQKGVLTDDRQVLLPSEAEWEKAARGGTLVISKMTEADSTVGFQFPEAAVQPNLLSKRCYPWGDEVGADCANYSKTGIGETSSAGCFPDGVSPYGCQDMAGNVWEWTRTLWGKDFSEPDFKYPYDFLDGREDVDAEDRVLRVLRGGSFLSYADDVRCAVRYWYYPYLRYDLIGFRVVLLRSPLKL